MVDPSKWILDMPSKPGKKFRSKWMPRMQSSSTQCCLCVVGVFIFLAGIIMVATGVCLILNYGYFDESLLPPELQSDDGKRTVGIILTVSGFVCIFISVLVSSIYLCSRKPTRLPQDTLDKIPSSARQDSAGSRSNTRGKVGPVNGKTTIGAVQKSGSKPGQSHKSVPLSKDMHSSTVPGPSRHQLAAKQRKRKKHVKLLHQKSKLEGIQEKDPDAISRKFSEKDVSLEEQEEKDDNHSDSPIESANAVSVLRLKENSDTGVNGDSSPSDTLSQEKQSLTSLTMLDSHHTIELPPINPQKPNIIISQHSIEETKIDFDRSSTSSGFTGSEKSESTYQRELSDLLK